MLPLYKANWVQGPAALQTLATELDEFVAACPAATVFCTAAWLLPAAKYLCARREVMVLTVRRDGQLVAFLPLTWGIEQVAFMPVRTLRYLGFPFSDRISLLLADYSTDTMAAVLDGVRGCPRRWDLLALDELLDADVQRIVAQVAKGKSPEKIRIRHCARSPVLSVINASSKQLSQRYSRSLRTRLTRARAKQAAAGRVEIRRVVGTADNCAEVVASLSAIEDASWKGEQGVGIFNASTTRDFFMTVTREFVTRDYLDIWAMYLDGRLIAYRWQPRFRGVALDYNFAHLPDFNGLSPGRVLLEESIDGSIERGLLSVDASRGSISRPHLLADWPTDCVDHYALWLANNTARGTLVHMLATRVNRWRKRMQSRLTALVSSKHKSATGEAGT